MDKDDKERIVNILMELISIVGLSGTEDKVAEYIKGRLAEAEIPFYERDGNVYAIKGNPEFLIATHMDTVPSWGYESAYRPYYDGERVWGRGAVDTRGQIAALLYAMKKGKNFFSVFLCDEEEGGGGSASIHIPDSLEIKGCIVLEPTSLKVCTCQAGSLEIEIYVKGRAAHGSVPNSGENAIERAMELFGMIKKAIDYNDPLFPESGINVGIIKGGIDCQVVPEYCYLRLDIPVLPEMDLEKVLKKISSLINRFSVEYKIIEKSKPWSISQKEWIVERLTEAYKEALNEEPYFSGMPAWTDASNIMEKGIPCVVFGAGELSCAHTSYESIHKDELYKLFLVIEKLIE